MVTYQFYQSISILLYKNTTLIQKQFVCIQSNRKSYVPKIIPFIFLKMIKFQIYFFYKTKVQYETTLLHSKSKGVSKVSAFMYYVLNKRLLLDEHLKVSLLFFFEQKEIIMKINTYANIPPGKSF